MNSRSEGIQRSPSYGQSRVTNAFSNVAEKHYSQKGQLFTVSEIYGVPCCTTRTVKVQRVRRKPFEVRRVHSLLVQRAYEI